VTTPNVLVLTDPVANYGAAFLFNGLCQVLGPEHVYDYPEKCSYHGDVDMGTWGNRSIPYGPYPWMPAWKSAWSNLRGNHRDCIEALRLLRDGAFAFCILESPRKGALQAYAELLADNGGGSVVRTPVALYDNEDTDGLAEGLLQIPSRWRPSTVFKRELRRGRSFEEMTVVPLPFSYPEMTVQGAPVPLFSDAMQEPKYAVSLLQGATHPYREEIAEALHALEPEYSCYIASRPSAHPNNQPWVDDWFEYVRIMRNSKIVVSVRGSGFDTVRRWEAAAHSCLACDDLDIVIPDDFPDGTHCLRYYSVDDCLRKIREALSSGAWRGIRDNGTAHLQKYHTNAARARTVLLTMLQKLPSCQAPADLVG
jgi:hypothetical protein